MFSPEKERIVAILATKHWIVAILATKHARGLCNVIAVFLSPLTAVEYLCGMIQCGTKECGAKQCVAYLCGFPSSAVLTLGQCQQYVVSRSGPPSF